MPPWWFRPSFHNFLASSRVPSTSLPVAIVTIGALLWVLVWVARATLRKSDDVARLQQRDDVVGPAAATAIVAVFAGLITAGRIPVGLFGASSHVYRWLWPLAAFVTFVFVIAIVRRLLGAFRPAFVVGGFAVIAIVFAALNIPTTDQGASASTSAIPVVRDLGHQLAALHGRGPFVVDLRYTPFADPYASAILAQLQGQGVPFVVNEEGMLHQVGFFRRFDGSNARGVLVIREGDFVDARPEGAERVALHLGLAQVERDRMAKLEDALAGYVADGRLTVNQRGRQRAKAVPSSSGTGTDARAFVRSSNFVDLARDDELALDPTWEETVTRYLELRKRWLDQTVAVYLEPISQLDSNA
jgi:hypothetical protein